MRDSPAGTAGTASSMAQDRAGGSAQLPAVGTSAGTGSVAYGAPGAAAPAPQAAPAAPPAVADKAAGSSAAGPAAGAASAPLDLGAVQGRIERSVTAQYVVPHGGFLTAFDAVVQRATSLGGFVLSSTTTPDGTGRIASGTVTVKVPAARLSDLVAGLPADFTVSSLDYGSQDHTAQTVDLNARVAAATAQRTALEGLLNGARSIGDITSLEQQIAQVQLEIDQDQGQLNAVNSSVDLATANIGLTEKGAKPAPPPPVHSENALLHALRTGGGNAVQLVAGGLLAAVTVLPVLLLVAFAAWLGRRRIRRLLRPEPPSA